MAGKHKPKERTRPPLDKEKSKVNGKKIVVRSNIEENQVLEDVLKEVLRDMSKDQLRERKRVTRNNLEAMMNTCSEFLDSFIIMGYDMKKKPIEPLFYAKTELEADALTAYLQRYIMTNFRGGDDLPL